MPVIHNGWGECGEKNRTSKLKAATVRQILKENDRGLYAHERFGISRDHYLTILRGESWKHEYAQRGK